MLFGILVLLGFGDYVLSHHCDNGSSRSSEGTDEQVESHVELWRREKKGKQIKVNIITPHSVMPACPQCSSRKTYARPAKCFCVCCPPLKHI